MSLITVSTLGTINVDGISGPELPARGKLVALLVYLARRSNGGVRREELAALFWGDKPEALARQSLRHALMRLRRAVGDDVLLVSADDVRVTSACVALDVTSFEQRLAAGELSAAVSLWRGDFLEAFEDAGGEAWRVWLEAEREGLRQKLAHALAALVEQAEARADWELASAWAEQWCTAMPLDHHAQLRWLQALRLAGRTMDAAAAHARVMHRLRDLGIEPEPALARLGDELARATRSAPLRVGSAPSVLREPDMVGRSAEFAALVAAWDDARANRGVVMLLEGEEGTGKTRLLEEFVRWQGAQPGRALVLHARAYESDRNEPLSTVRELLSGLQAAPGLSGAPDQALAELAELIPAIAIRFRNLPPARGTPDARARALTQVLGDVASELPVVLALDDFTAADAASARLVLSLVRHPPDGLLIVLAARSHCLDATGYGAELVSTANCRRVRLDALSITEMDAAIASMLDMHATARRALVARIHADTAGNPLYLVELVAALVEEGRLHFDADGSCDVELSRAQLPLPLSDNLKRGVRARLDRLDETARRVVDAAACLGARATVKRLAALARVQGDELDRALNVLSAEKFVAPGGGAGLEFTHEIVRRAVCDAIPPARRQQYERRLAQPLAWRLGRRAALAATFVATVSVGLLAFWRQPTPELPVLAVGEITDQTDRDSSAINFPVRDLLATRLATLPHLPVISPERMHELRAQEAAAPAAVRTMHAARRAGADEIVQGVLLRGTNSELRLELRRVSLASGAVTAAYTVSGPDVLALIDSATSQIAAGFGIPVRPGRPDVPASLVAYRLYEEGLRAYYQGDGAAAHRFFSAALDEDSTFAMAAFYDWESKYMAGLLRANSNEELARVVKLAEKAPRRESLLIRAKWASHVHAPERLALAETLAIRYPLEPDGHLLVGAAKYAAGDFLGAIPHYRTVLDMDTASARAEGLPCKACDALAAMTSAYSLADSLPAAKRAAIEWTRLQPNAARAWAYLATTLEYEGRFSEALATRRNALALRPGDRVDVVYPARLELRQEHYQLADQLLRQRMSEGPVAVAREAAWFLVISLRQQGRLQEALRVAREYTDSLAAAVVLLELGQPLAAALFFESRAHRLAQHDSLFPRHNDRIWSYAHAATARAALGDAAALQPLADSMRAIGMHTSKARHSKLHYYAAGLLHAARGEHQAAIRAFERSITSLTNGYSRINLELARSLLATGQARRAAGVLEAALRGPLDAGNYYVNRSELRALLGNAYEAAGMPELAAAQYQHVARAWQDADASFEARRAELQARLAALDGQKPATSIVVRR